MRDLGPDPAPDRRGAFLRGVLATVPVQAATVPFGVIFGIVAADGGLDLVQIFAFASIVMAGASSFVALQMMQDGVPLVMVILGGAVVNLRMAMYSAALVPHWQGAGRSPRLLAGYMLNDQTFALSLAEYERRARPLSERLAFFFGSGCCCIPIWTASVMAGALVGQRVPESWGLAVAVPLLFLALTAPMVRTAPQAVAGAVAVLAALVTADLPHGLGVIAASLTGIAAGMAATRIRP